MPSDGWSSHSQAAGAEEGLVEAFSGIAALVSRPGVRTSLERAAAVHQSSAAILRAHGRDSEARRVERFASRVRLTLDEPQAMERLDASTEALDGVSRSGLMLERALDGAISLLGSDFGNIQLRDPATGTLRIASAYGFSSEFLEYFAAVGDDSSACGRAAKQQSQVVIVDVNEDLAFAPHREIAAASGFRAVQSTPIIDPVGRLRGVISTHFRRSHRPSKRELQIMYLYGERVGAVLARRHSTAADAPATPAGHPRTVLARSSPMAPYA